MNLIDVQMVRVYITEESKLLKPIIHYLRTEAKVRGISVFRAISGYGDSGELETTFTDLFLNLPLTIEFFDQPENVKKAVAYISTLVKPEHIVFWDAKAND